MKILKMTIFLLVLFIAVGGVCAADHVSQDMIGEDVGDSLESTQSDIALENEQNKIYSVDDSTKTYTDLINEIDNTQGNVLDLKYDYKFDNSTDNSGIPVSRDDFVINGNGHTIDGSNLKGCFGIFANNVTINNLTIRNTSFSLGSAIYINGGSLTTNNVIFENNTVSGNGVVSIEKGSYVSNYDKFIGSSAANSGVITITKGSLEINNALMADSRQLLWGFIQTLDRSPVTVVNSTFANATSNYSAAIRAGGTTIVRNSKFINLVSLITAGAIGVKEIDECIIDNCTFINVTSDKNGGAIFADVQGFEHSPYGDVLINRSSFINCSSGFGGAILHLGGNLTIMNSNFTDNYAVFDGGALYISNSNVTIRNSLFNNNSALYPESRGSFGGAIFFDLGTLNLLDSNLTLNSAQSGSGVYLYDSNYTIDGCVFDKNINFNGRYDDIYTVFDKDVTVLGDNKYGSDDSKSLNNTFYATIVMGEGLPLTLIENTIDVTTIPSKFDLRDWGWVTSVKDQGRMGSCWSFGGSAAMESAILRYLGLYTDLSENNMQDLSLKYYMYGSNSSFEANNGFAPGEYAVSWLGVFNEKYDVYDQLGKISPIFATPDNIHIQDFIIIPPRTSFTDNNPLKEAVLKYGAVTVNYYAISGGPEQYYNGTATINHAVTLIGWDDDKEIAGAPDKGAWLVKNSWGKQAGDNGYQYISYYDTSFSTVSLSFAYSVENTVSYNMNYQYDIQGLPDFMNYTTEYQNHYQAVEDDLIAGIGTYFDIPGANYTVEIYVNDALKLVQNGVIPFAGFHTVKLDTYVPIKEGDLFTVKITSTMVPALTGARQHLISGLSEYFYNGTWIDSASQNKVCVIKAYTVADDTKIINNNDIAVDYAGGSYFSVKVVTDDGHAVGMGATVKFKINGADYYATTNADGIASIQIKDAPGKYSITTTYNGKTYNNTVTVKNVLSASKVTIKKKTAKKLVLTAKLKINGKAVKGKWITFKINGKTYKAKTNKYGTAKKTLNKKAIKALKKGKTYKVKVTFSKDTIKTSVKIK